MATLGSCSGEFGDLDCTSTCLRPFWVNYLQVGDMASVGFCASGFVSAHVCLRGFLANYKGPQAEVTSEGGAGSSHLCGYVQQVAGGTRIACPSGHLLWKNVQQLLSQWSPPGGPTSHHSLESDLWLLLQQLESRLCCWQGDDNCRAKRRTCPISSVGSGHHNASVKGIMARTPLGKTWHTSIPNSLDSSRLCRDALT